MWAVIIFLMQIMFHVEYLIDERSMCASGLTFLLKNVSTNVFFRELHRESRQIYIGVTN